MIPHNKLTGCYTWCISLVRCLPAGCVSEENVRALFFAGSRLVRERLCTEVEPDNKQLFIRHGKGVRDIQVFGIITGLQLALDWHLQVISLDGGCAPQCPSCRVGSLCSFTIAIGLHYDDIVAAIAGWFHNCRPSSSELFSAGVDRVCTHLNLYCVTALWLPCH